MGPLPAVRPCRQGHQQSQVVRRRDAIAAASRRQMSFRSGYDALSVNTKTTRHVASLKPPESRLFSKLDCLFSMHLILLTMVRDQETASQREAMCSRCTAKTMKLTCVNQDEYDSPHSQEHPPKRRKTEDDAVKDVIDGRKSPCQTVQPYHGNALYISGTGTPPPVIDSEKPMQIDSETLDISNQDALLEDIGKPTSNGTQLAESRKSFVKAPGSAETSIDGEQQKLDLNAQILAEKPACTRTTEDNGQEGVQDSSHATSPQVSGSINQESSDKYTHYLRSSTRSPTNTSAENQEVKVERSSTPSAKPGNGSSDVDGVLPSPYTLSRDSVVSFPLCTNCGTKRVFNIPRNGETDNLW